MKYMITRRSLIVYAIAIGVAWILTEIVWGAAGGIVAGLSIKNNPAYQHNVTAFLKDKGVDTQAGAVATRDAYSKLSPEDRKELNNMSRDAMRDANWFAVTLVVSILVFGVVGLFCGIISKSWVLSPLIPTISFLLNNPIIRFPMAKELPPAQKFIVVAIQFIACCCLAILGANFAGKKRNNGQQAVPGYPPQGVGSPEP